MPPPPPPPPPAPPPTFSLACTEKPTLTKSEQSGRHELLSDICNTRKLKKTVTNDRSAPVLSAPKGPGDGVSGGGGGGGGGPAGLGGLFAGGMPKLRSAGARDSSDSGGGRPPLLPPGGRSTGPRPFAPNNAPPRLPGSLSFPKSSNAEPPRNKFPPASQPKFSRPDISSKSDARPPPVPNAPRPSALSTQNRGPPPFPGNRPANTGPSPPNRNPGSFRQFSPIPPPSNTNRSYPTPSPGKVGEDKPCLSTPPTHNTNRPPLPPTPARVMDDRPPPPPMMNRPLINRDGPPLPPPQHQKPPVPQTPRPTPSFQTPPPPPNRLGPPHSHPGAATDVDVPRLPQRNLSLHSSCSSTSPGPIRSGPLPPSERPPPPIRDPPSRSGPLPPPPPGGRNGSSHKAPPVPQPPSRMGSDNLRSGFKPPLPPDRGSPVPPPTTMRNGFQEPPLTLYEDEWEGRFSFHSILELPPPEPYINFPKTYPSKQSKPESRDPIRRERGAPPLPPLPPIPPTPR